MAGVRLTKVSHFFANTRLRVIATLSTRSYPRAKHSVDFAFERYLREIGRADLLTPSFANSPVSRTDSLVQEIAKYDREYVYPSIDVRRYVYTSMLRVVCRFTQLHLFEGREKLQFISPMDALLSMNLDTSPGYPWSQVAQSKRELIDGPDREYLFQRVEEIWRSQDDTDGVQNLFFAFLKDELRPIEKIRQRIPVIRSISGAPVDLSICGNQLSHDINESFYRNHAFPDFGSVVGSTPYYGGWDRIATSHFGDPEFPRNRGTSIDVSGWDRSYSPYLFEIVVRLRQMFINSVGSDELKSRAHYLATLYRDVVNSAVVVQTPSFAEIVMLVAGMKSGWVNTTTDNTLGHMIVLISFLFSKGLQEEIGRGVLFSLYGDDNLLSWNERYDNVFTEEALKSWYAAWGFTLHGVGIARDGGCYDLVFLGGSFALCPMTGMRVYRPEYGQKAIDSVRYKYRDIDTCFQRVNALRILHFYNDETYVILDGYAHELMRGGMVSKDILKSYLDGNSIAAIHTGRESGDGRLFSPSAPDIDNPFERHLQ